MNEMTAALVGAAAAVAIGSRGLRPVAKLTMKGLLAAGDATSGARRGIMEIYEEARAERRGEASLERSERDAPE